MGKLLSRAQCEELRSLYSNASLFRSRIDMERYRFGRGEYQYFAKSAAGSRRESLRVGSTSLTTKNAKNCRKDRKENS